MNKYLLGPVCAVALIVGGGTGARADEVTDWNEMLFRASVAANASPLNMSRHSALVQAAVFDAVNGIEKRYTPIHVDPTGPGNASRRAAAVQAAYAILVRLYGLNGVFTPNQQPTLDARRTASLADIGADESAAAVDSGIAWGRRSPMPSGHGGQPTASRSRHRPGPAARSSANGGRLRMHRTRGLRRMAPATR